MKAFLIISRLTLAPTLRELYTPLDESKNETRLVLITISPEIGHIQLDLTIESLDDLQLAFESNDRSQLYRALSYEWSPDITDGTQPETLSTASGQELHLTANLVSFLLHLPALDPDSSGGRLAFWIDAICINQEDLAERASQVRRMHRVYGTAVQVWAWVGPEHSDSASAAALLNALIPVRTEKQMLRRLLASVDSPGWSALVQLLKRSYWRRGWVAQELHLAPSALLVCGKSTIHLMQALRPLFGLNLVDFNLLPLREDMVQRWRARTTRLAALLPQFARSFVNRKMGDLWSLDQLERARHILAHLIQCWRPCMTLVCGPNYKETGSSLLDCLVMYRFARTSDPRDKVYSLLSFAKPYKDDLFPVNYTTSWQEVYRNVFVYVLENTYCLDILSQAGLNDHGFPTWIPDWTNPISDKHSRSINIISATRDLVAGELYTTESCSAGGDLSTSHYNQIVHTNSELQIIALAIADITGVFDAEPLASEPTLLAPALSARMHFLAAPHGNSMGTEPASLWQALGKELHMTLAVVEFENSIVSERLLKYWLKGFWEASSVRPKTPRESTKMVHALESLRRRLSCRSLFVFDRPAFLQSLVPQMRHSFGVCRVPVQRGDRLYAVPGCVFPLIMRPVKGAHETYQIVGPGSLWNLTDGQALGKAQESRITII